MSKTPPTLRRSMILSLGLMVAGMLVIATGSIVAVQGLHQDLGVAVQGYRQLRQLFNVGFLASRAREAVSANPPRPELAVSALQSALLTLDQRSDADSVDGPPANWVDESARRDCRTLLLASIDHFNHSSPRQADNQASLNQLFAQLAKIADDVRLSIASAQKAADVRQRVTMTSIVCLAGVVLLGAVAIGIRQYRRVIRPIRQISAGVRAFTAGNLDRRIDLPGDLEFIALTADFNQMAGELQALYRDLEAKVAAKSTELVRSRRLAGIGYLAAGVAHEINNPLGIIAGYAERALQRLAAAPQSGSPENTLPEEPSQIRNALTVICEETFRCKQITEQLLSLARPGAQNRTVISIANIAQAVISTLSGLGTIGQRSLVLNADPNSDLTVLANEGELKQLLLNLVINAVQATDPQSGKVQLNILRTPGGIELSVIDNGQGMDQNTIDHLFQPFFSRKAAPHRGSGLGLCIAQAIVTEHGGLIHAHSAGIGAGSSFTVRLPAAKPEASVAAAR